MRKMYPLYLWQDDPHKKPTSLIADFDKMIETVHYAIEHKKQFQPIIIQYLK